MLEQAVLDWTAPPGDRGVELDREDAFRWLFDPHPSEAHLENSFESVCGFLDLDPAAVREGLQRRFMAEDGAPPAAADAPRRWGLRRGARRPRPVEEAS
ncbi:MAG: hypothetical protein M5U09_13665 [Gammaproteobacteria bacterium]|nr:hypothetical protein [Gammaproteobacteria bacterium]